MANEQSATDGAHSTAQRHSGGAELVAKAWVLLDELDNVRSAPPGEGDWRALNKADDELRVALDGIEAEPAHASEYPPLPKPALPRGGFPDLFDADQMRTYADATCAMRAQAAHAAMAGPTNEEIDAHVDAFRWDTAAGRSDLVRAALARWRVAPAAQRDAWRDLCWQIADALECTPCAADEVLPKVLTVAEDAARWRAINEQFIAGRVRFYFERVADEMNGGAA